ncbi:MAG TPA: TRAP transporter small permease subunit [Afifellaceae bacterium]|nr:TRAP transporter small permease subunit [Afifellaceae bacterium]
MQRAIRFIDALNYRIGRTVMWLAIVIALIQFATVILRYVFAVGFIPVQESIWYLNAVMFMAGAGFALYADAHVRIDVVYRQAWPRTKAMVDLLGGLFLLLPVCVALVWLSFGYVVRSWRILEGSTEVSGLPLIFALKSFIWVFAALVGLQGIAMIGRAWLAITGRTEGYGAAGIKSDSLL